MQNYLLRNKRTTGLLRLTVGWYCEPWRYSTNHQNIAVVVFLLWLNGSSLTAQIKKHFLTFDSAFASFQICPDCLSDPNLEYFYCNKNGLENFLQPVCFKAACIVIYCLNSTCTLFELHKFVLFVQRHGVTFINWPISAATNYSLLSPRMHLCAAIAANWTAFCMNTLQRWSSNSWLLIS